MPPPDETPSAAEPAPAPPDSRDPLADARDAALERDQGIVDALVGPVAAHFREAIDQEDVVFVGITVIVGERFARTVPILPGVDDPERRQLAMYLAAQQFGKTHAIYSKRTAQNLQLAARQPDE